MRLAERGYFDGLAVHRVVPNFVIQDGDPTGTGSGGPGYTIRCEVQPAALRRRHGRAWRSRARTPAAASGSSRTRRSRTSNGRYTIFAHVVRGMDVVWRIVQGDQVTKVEIRA
mgnify:CR=1 FL=1